MGSFTFLLHSHPITLVVLAGIFLVMMHHRRYNERNPRRLPHPPGPKPLPVLGNFFDVPRNFVSGPYQKMSKEHGELVFLSALGKDILLVSSFKATNDLFEKRSLNYSDRFQSPMSFELYAV